MKTLNFKLGTKTESIIGTADIVDFITTGILNAATHFFMNNDVTRNFIGVIEFNEKSYSIYENYIDSGSDNYYYFAVDRV